MKTEIRHKQALIHINKIALALPCSVAQAESMFDCVESLKMYGTPQEKLPGYITQHMYKLGLDPAYSCLEAITSVVSDRSIYSDMTEKSRNFCNPIFPFIAMVHYTQEPCWPVRVRSEGTHTESVSPVSAEMHRQPPPRRTNDFYFIEENMPEQFYVMVSNSRLSGLLDTGLPKNLEHPLMLWKNKLQAQDAFLGELDSMHNQDMSLYSNDRNQLCDGTLIGVSSEYVKRDPEVFFPLNRKGRFVSMNYADAISPEALNIVALDLRSLHLDPNVDAFKIGVVKQEESNRPSNIDQIG